MEKPTWTIVKFSEDDTVEAVPSNWIEQNKCYWPPFKYEKVIAAIRKNAERNTCWPCYDIIIFRNSTYDDYNTARLKTKKAECTSDLNSEIEENKKRKRKKNQLYMSDTDNDDDADSDQNNNSPKKRKEMKEDEIIKKKIGTADTLNSTEESEESDNVLPKHPQMKESNSKPNFKINASGSKITDIPSTRDLLNNSPNNNHLRNDAYPNNVPHSTRDNSSDNAKYFKEIIRQQNYFKTQLWQMTDDLREIKTMISDNLGQKLDANKQQNTKSIYTFDLPLKTVEEIEGAVEIFLQNEDYFERSCIETCAIGGTSPYNFIKRNLDRLVTNNAAQQYSWLGAKQKRKFCNLRIANMLLTAGAAYSNSYTKLELEKAIQKWLKRAKERHDAEIKKVEARENSQ